MDFYKYLLLFLSTLPEVKLILKILEEMSPSAFSSMLPLEGSGQVNICRGTVFSPPSLPKYSVSREN